MGGARRRRCQKHEKGQAYRCSGVRWPPERDQGPTDAQGATVVSASEVDLFWQFTSGMLCEPSERRMSVYRTSW